MLVVMEQGYAVKAGQAAPAAVLCAWGGGRAGPAGNAAFGELVINDLVPMIDSTYRTLDDRHSRAIAGLSMGAGQAMQIGLRTWIGSPASVRSAAAAETSTRRHHKEGRSPTRRR